MSTVFKKFSKSDVSITPFNAHKQTGPIQSSSFVSIGGSFTSASFPTIAYRNGSGFEWAGTGSEDGFNHKKYFQLDHLFYRNSKLEYHNKFSTPKYFDHYRVLYDKVNIISVPYKTIGYKIKPKSVELVEGRYKDDGKGNLYDSKYYSIDTFGNPTSNEDYSNNFINENFHIFNLGPQNGFKYYDLSIRDGKQLVNFEPQYHQTGALDDSFYLNEIDYISASFSSKMHNNIKTLTQFPTIDFNQTTIKSPHNYKFDFNSEDDFAIAFNVSKSLYHDNKKRYVISKSTTKTIIPSSAPNVSTRKTGSFQEKDVPEGPQFPFEIYFQSNSLHFERFDGNILSSVQIPIFTASLNDGAGLQFMDHVICQKTGSTLQIWKKNSLGTMVLEATTTDKTKNTQNKANLYIGSKGGTTNFFTGSLSFISIYNTSLNNAQINGRNQSTTGKPYIGNVFYNQGLITITHPSYQPNVFRVVAGDSIDNEIQYQGTHLIYENEYQCMAEKHEFDITLNPSARKIKSKDEENLADFAIKSTFKPYVTTIGLYNDDGELLVVGKLGQAIRMSDEADTTYVVRFDT